MTAPDILIAPHHPDLTAQMERAARGDVRRLMVLMPPRSGKTTAIADIFLPLYANNHPGHKISLCSYDKKISENIARRVGIEGLIPISPHYSMEDTKIDCMVFDDIDGVRFNETRKNNYLWYSSFLKAHLSKDGVVIFIASRQSKKDVAGLILENSKEGDWEILKIPAAKEDGETCWPYVLSTKTLMDIKRQLSIYQWEALYQQAPVE
jgi:hypothetical protein